MSAMNTVSASSTCKVVLFGAGVLFALSGAVCKGGDPTPDTSTASTATAGGGGAATTSGQGGGGSGGWAAPPKLGFQIDRAGRPLINIVAHAAFLENIARGIKQDSYNANDIMNSWPWDHKPDIVASLAVWDALDLPDDADPKKAGCGNQPLASSDGDPLAGGAYDALATVLANDKIQLGGESGDPAYLGVEATALGLSLPASTGGRTPPMDVVEATYSMLSGSGLTGLDDGVAAPQGIVDAFKAGFPYLP